MPRWEHGSEDRLKKAAIELFDEQGFENTSVIEISERARARSRPRAPGLTPWRRLSIRSQRAIAYD